MLTSQPTHKSKVFDFFINHTVAVLTFIFTLVSLAIFVDLHYLSNEQIKNTALKNARLYTQTLIEFRSIYTSEVVFAAKKKGLKVTHDYATIDNAIPLPATLSMMLGNRLGGQDSGVNSKLYSPYPFPWRADTGGLNDSFSEDAWQALTNNPSQPYYRFEVVDDNMTLRYASADLMRESCINCHNSHMDTPKSDWKTGDVRGILEITTTIDDNIMLTNDMIRQTLYLLISILALTLIVIGLVMRQLRLRTTQALQLAATSIKANSELAKEVKVRHQAEHQLLMLSLTDGLTGIANRRKFDQEFAREWRRALRTTNSLAIILFDVDHFKPYNDNYGHQQGDEILRTIANVMESSIQRASDLLCRFGGEEFIVLLPDTDIEGALLFSEQVRNKIESCQIRHDFAPASRIVTVSAGIAAIIPTESTTSNKLIKAADDALYLAKHAGRNCVRYQNVLDN